MSRSIALPLLAALAAIAPADALALWPLEGSGPRRTNAQPGFADRPPFGVVWSRGNLGRSEDRTKGFVEHASTVGGGRVYVQVINGTVTALEASSGAIVWQRKLGTKAAAAPAYSTRRRIVVVHNHKPGRLYVLNPATGATRWARPTGGGETSPLLLTGGIFVANKSGVVMKFTYTGRRVWRRPLGRKITGSIASSRYLIVSDYGGYIRALRPRNGRVVWRRYAGRSHYAAPVIHRGRVYQTSREGRIHALSVRTGRVAWSRTLGWLTRARAAPTIARGRVYAASFNGWVYCYRWNGSRCWRKRFPGSVKGALASTGGRLVWVCHRRSDQRWVKHGTLRALEVGTGRVVWSFPVCSHAPISTDGHRLYVHGFARVRALAAVGA